MANTHRGEWESRTHTGPENFMTQFMNGAYYNFPGGGVEEGETLAECTKREVLEESGITVHVEEMLFTLEVESRRWHG